MNKIKLLLIFEIIKIKYNFLKKKIKKKKKKN